MYFVVKADFYGLGHKKLLKAAQNRVDGFAVAYSFEGRKLIKQGALKPIMVLLPQDGKGYRECFKWGLEPSVGSYEALESYLVAVKRYEIEKGVGISRRIHIAVNVGMNRFGISTRTELLSLISKAKENGVLIQSVYSHLPQIDKIETENEIKEFNRLTCGIEGIEKQLLASFGIENCKNICYNTIRCGLLPYGISEKISLYPVLKLTSRVIALRMLKKGDKLSYGDNYVAKKDVSVAILSIGYADGFSRNYNGACVKINGHKSKIVGNVCMDVCFCEINGFSVKIGDEAVIFDTGEEVIALAKRAKIPPHEVLTRLTKRVKRVYYD